MLLAESNPDPHDLFVRPFERTPRTPYRFGDDLPRVRAAEFCVIQLQLQEMMQTNSRVGGREHPDRRIFASPYCDHLAITPIKLGRDFGFDKQASALTTRGSRPVQARDIETTPERRYASGQANSDRPRTAWKSQISPDFKNLPRSLKIRSICPTSRTSAVIFRFHRTIVTFSPFTTTFLAS